MAKIDPLVSKLELLKMQSCKVAALTSAFIALVQASPAADEQRVKALAAMAEEQMDVSIAIVDSCLTAISRIDTSLFS